MTARAITKTLGGMWTNKNYGLVRCPCHDDRKPSLKIKDDANKRDGIDLHCFAGCSWQDVKAELSRQGLIETTTSPATMRSTTAGATPKPKPSKPELSPEDRTRIALGIWQQSIRLNDTLGWKYFTERRQLHIGLLGDLRHCLRWCEKECAVIALMTDPLTNAAVGIHRTFLNPDGTKRERRMLGKAGIIRLSRDEDVLEGLGIAEGLEDTLSILLSGWSPVWCATSANGIKSFPVLVVSRL
jgi:hypothetical protein